MTAIVGIARDGRVMLGADSAAAGHGQLFAVRTPKLIRLTLRDGLKIKRVAIIGYTTSFRLGDILRRHMGDVAHGGSMDADEWMIAEFIPSLRGALTEGGFMKKENEREEGGEFLVGTEGRLFVVQEDFSVIEPAGGEMAVGAGADFALGALHATAGRPADKRIAAALEAAEAWSNAVRGPMFTITLDGDGK